MTSFKGEGMLTSKPEGSKIQDFILPRQSKLINPGNNEFVVLARRKIPFEGWICHQAVCFRLDNNTGFAKQDGVIKMPPRALASEANADYDSILKRLSQSGYRSIKNNSGGRPKGVCEMNWDFDLNIPKKLSVFCKNSYKAFPTKYLEKSSQANNPASSWYSGSMPDPKSLAGYVGSPSVDASQLQASFGGVHDAIQLVNQFDSSLLRNVAFIFNTSGGAYGVYVPWLDEQIKNAEVKEFLRRKGFVIEDSNPSFFAAYSQDPKVGEDEIKREIENTQSQVKMQGGNTFGINMSKIMSAARADANESGMTDQEDFYDLAVLHLGSTMVHEAVHAKGSHSEGPSEQAEATFTQWALEILNKKRLQKATSKGEQEEYAPLIVNPNMRRSWYDREISKKIEKAAQFGAQFSNQTSPSLLSRQWGGLMLSKNDPIESALGATREGPRRGKPYEQRLREQARTLPDINPTEVVEMLLEKDHDEFSSYQSIEDLLEERRPKPLAIMVDKNAGTVAMVKTADESYNSTFGWMNNLDLPMSERIITEEEMDDFQNFDWGDIRKLPRYNPEHDRYGIYYRWYEPRMNSPELWDRMVSERSSISPSLRFAQASDDNHVGHVIDVLSVALEKIASGEIAGTRFICDEKMLPFIDRFYGEKNGVSVYATHPLGKCNGNDLHSLWLVDESIPQKAVSIAEAYASGQTNDALASDVFEHITGLSKQRKKVIDEVLGIATELAHEMGMKDLYILGSFPRAILSKESWANVIDLNFSYSDPQDCIKFGSILADRIGSKKVAMSKEKSTFLFVHKGLVCNFRGNWTHSGTRELMSSVGIKITPLSMDVYSRDFTINMFVYRISNGKVYDITGQGKRDFQYEEIRTYFNPDELIKRNPIVILRAIKYACKYGFSVANDLKKAIANNINRLLGSYSNERIKSAVEEIMREGEQRARSIIVGCGIDGLLSILETDKE